MERLSKDLYVLILAGGVGSRLWPKSRQKTPKHLLPLHSDKTMIQETFDRVKTFVNEENIFVITHQDHQEEVKRQLPAIPSAHVIAEPMVKNTALAMGLGAAVIGKENPEAVVINVAADHVIKDQKSFEQAMLAAADAASRGDYLVTVGIIPTFAHTGLGYIRVGEEFDEIDSLPVFKVRGFREKPNLASARAFIASKEYFWNANLYTWKSSAIANALEKFQPEISKGIRDITEAYGTSSQQSVMNRVYEAALDVQIDKGVSEKARNLLMIPGNFGWSDIGDWSVLHEVREPVEEGNVIIGDRDSHIGLDTKNTLVHTNGRMIATIGLENMIVIDTPDALLICPKDKVQDVKKIVEELKKTNKKDYL